MIRWTLMLSCVGALISTAAFAGSFEYSADGVVSEGYTAVPKNVKPRTPGVLIIHDWMGPSAFTRQKAEEVASLGYIAFSADIYGKGNSPKDMKEASAIAGKFKADRKMLRARVIAAFNELKKNKDVDPQHIVVMGYCFGGTTALELGRSGADVAGIVSFHGGLANPTPADARNIKGKSLIMHGALDPYVNAEEVTAFQKEMNEAGVDYQFISYSGAVHAFAVPGAGNDIKTGAAFNAIADRRSWEEFKRFMLDVTAVRK